MFKNKYNLKNINFDDGIFKNKYQYKRICYEKI